MKMGRRHGPEVKPLLTGHSWALRARHVAAAQEKKQSHHLRFHLAIACVLSLARRRRLAMGNASGRVDDIADADMDESFLGGRGSQVSRASSAGYVRGSPPGSPPRPHSPRMFVPQSPVTPLQKTAEVPPVFNQILMHGQQEDVYGPPQKKIPTLLTWALGGKNIYVEGSWDNWATKKPVEKSGKDHTILLMLSSGIHRYRFIVDGERRFIPDLPCETDNMGRVVNLVDVHV
ncbi:hypothetical protein PR202_gb22075 [Eleusine coracana subsp. coracana]|uniref:AMP-activated protein kinase glycogen-binding domain-containing protein n=1 Tax=Eleusine coracana subsp. coracana TaxID=191504 RepID=A0AAV5FFC5_ELECO|nr:hypothetical protein PR202_gb22075 [Eleusine coracana subsp. coracana]